MLSKHVEDERNLIEIVALNQLVPENQMVWKAIDFEFFYELVEDNYCLYNG
jgi:hypothetical protein